MANGTIEKMEIDFSSTVDEKLPIIKELAKSGSIQDAVDQILSIEKQTRSASDAISTGRLLEALVEIFREAGKWKMLEEYLVVMTKKRGQSKQASTKMVQAAAVLVNDTPDMAVKLALIDTLRKVSAGKIYVEVERARLTKQLADIKEAEGDIEGAATVLHELQVETYGSMEKREKVEFILEQMRLGLLRRDLVRTHIISKKINVKFFQDPETDALKRKFYTLMIELDSLEAKYLDVSKHYQQLLSTSASKESEAERHKSLRYMVLFALLAPQDNEQHDLLHRIKLMRELEALPLYKEILETFTTREIIPWGQLRERYETQIRAETDVLGDRTDYEESCDEPGAVRWRALRDRVVEHNIRTVAQYYTRLRVLRLAQLLDLDPSKAEDFLSQAVINKTVSAKIDRLNGVIEFVAARSPTELLNDWSLNLNNLMTLVGKTTHLINKEKMIHMVK